MYSRKIDFRSLLLVAITELLLIRSTCSCGGRRIIQSGVSQHDKQVIVDGHNKLRQIVALGQIGGQPPAANMATLRWSDQLAQRAQQWASSCNTQVHDPGRHIGQVAIGQNIATTWTTATPSSYYDMQANWVDGAISKWFNENSLYRFNGFVGASTGHYTQLIWAETTHIGCGYAFYLDGNKYTKKYVCNYGPSGNVVGEQPYQTGFPSCFAHGMISSRTYPGLCEASATEMYNFQTRGYFSNDYSSYYNKNTPKNYHQSSNNCKVNCHSYSDHSGLNNYYYDVLNYVG